MSAKLSLPRLRAVHLWVLMLGLWAGRAAAAASAVFYWVDDAGSLQKTVELRDVPEPFAAMYRAQQSGRATEPSQAADAGDSGQPNVRTQRQQRQQLQAKVRRLRDELQATLMHLVAADAARTEAGFNPVLRQTPVGRARLAQAELERALALKQLRRVRHALEVELPEAARRDNLPPAWLQAI